MHKSDMTCEELGRNKGHMESADLNFFSLASEFFCRSLALSLSSTKALNSIQTLPLQELQWEPKFFTTGLAGS